MIVIPAVDIKNGKCVRLVQGRKEDETVFSDDPAAMARKWAREGAELIHVIDLDGAFEKSPQNLEAIKKILQQAGTFFLWSEEQCRQRRTEGERVKCRN